MGPDDNAKAGAQDAPPPATVEAPAALHRRLVGRAGRPTWRRALFWLWLGQIVSHFGDSLFHTGIFFLALQVTGSKAQSGMLLALNFLPALGVGLFAGAFVDRHDRRRVLLLADLVRAAAVAAIPVLAAAGWLSPVTLGAAMLTLATGSAFFNPAIKAIIPELVPATHLTATATIFQLSEYAALGLGPAVAGLVIIPALGSIHLFSLDAGTFVVSTLCVLALAPVARKTAHTPAPLRLSRMPTSTADAGALPFATLGVVRETLEGVRAVLANPAVRGLLAFIAFDNLLLTGLQQVATPLLIKETLGLGNDSFARVQSFFFLGMLVASALIWALARRLPKGMAILLGITFDGLTMVPLAFCQTLNQVAFAMFVHALAVPLIIIPRTVLLQQLVPGPLHGRAFALINVTVFGMTAISAGATGWLAELVPPARLFLVLGVTGTVVGLLGLLGLGVKGVRSAR
jgi:DHA3 family macrolide efflux protein-like MFS transporter